MQKAKLYCDIFTEDEIDKFMKLYCQESGAVLQVKHYKIDTSKSMCSVKCKHITDATMILDIRKVEISISTIFKLNFLTFSLFQMYFTLRKGA